jgi:CheY-like chemotaxis protein
MSTILIVDDDEPFRGMICTVLEIHGFNVVPAADSTAGLELAASRVFDAVLSDFQMPKADGLSFCRALQQQNSRLARRVPVWLMTGTATLTEKEALDAGAEGVFRKPFHAVEIAKTLERRCRIRRGKSAPADRRSRAAATTA